jgi:D-sedoheptulose 7-phosphate isomerase
MDYLELLIERYPRLNSIKTEINNAFFIIANSYAKGGKLLIAGNGGSAADSEHITTELMKNFLIKRNLSNVFIKNIKKIDSDIAQYLITRLQPSLPAIALSCHTSLNTAVINDIDGNIIFAQQVYGYGKEGDVFLGISTAGNSKNLLYAAATAKAKNLSVIALTGADGGSLRYFADVSIIVPEIETYKIQELHLPVYHCLCMMLEEHFFNESCTS